MVQQSIGHLEIIVNTLLQIGERVLEISNELVVANLWGLGEENSYSTIDASIGCDLGKEVPQSLFGHSTEYIRNCIVTREKQQFTYQQVGKNGISNFDIRIVPFHPDGFSVFMVLTKIPLPAIVMPNESEMHLALDVAADGVWEIELETSRIRFSNKWKHLLGYEPSEITTVSQWTDLIHPDDLDISRYKIEKYLAGEMPFYSNEIRCRAKRGGYKWILTKGVFVSMDKNGLPGRFIGTHTDIDEQKKADEQYYATANLLSNLIENLGSGILVTNEEGRIIFANQAFCNLYGLSIKPSELTGIHVSDGIRERMKLFKESELFCKRSFEHLHNKQKVMHEEWELTDGRTFARDYIPLSFGAGKTGEIWKLKDITQLKGIDKRFEKQRVFYEDILNHIAADVVVFSPDGSYLFINPTAIKNPEVRNWMIGKTDYDYCKLRGRPLYLADRRTKVLKDAFETRLPIEWEEQLMAPDGHMEYHLRYMYPVFDEAGTAKMGIGYGLCITDRVVAREALKTSQELFASAFDNSGTGMGLCTPGGTWIDVNNAMCFITGYSKEEMKTLHFQDLTYQADLLVDADLLQQMLQKEIKTYNVEKRFVSKQQKIVWVMLTVSLVWAADNSPKFFIAQVVDITRKKEMTDELNRRNAELEAARISLVNKITQLEDLSHMIAHNLRGPVANITMLAEELSNMDTSIGSMAPTSPFTTDEAIMLIREGSRSLSNHLNVLMEITQIKLNRNIPHQNCDIASVLNGIVNQLHGIIYEKNVDIRQALLVTEVSYPKVYLESILYNLISNAIKYSKNTEPPVITVSTRQEGDKVVLSVKDNGLGIDMEKYGERVFKLNQVFHTGYDSRGVGLFITKTQIESLGGTIHVESQPGIGSEFFVAL